MTENCRSDKLLLLFIGGIYAYWANIGKYSTKNSSFDYYFGCFPFKLELVFLSSAYACSLANVWCIRFLFSFEFFHFQLILLHSTVQYVNYTRTHYRVQMQSSYDPRAEWIFLTPFISSSFSFSAVPMANWTNLMNKSQPFDIRASLHTWPVYIQYSKDENLIGCAFLFEIENISSFTPSKSLNTSVLNYEIFTTKSFFFFFAIRLLRVYWCMMQPAWQINCRHVVWDMK